MLVYKVRMADGVAARTDGVDIYLDDRLDEIQERCAVVHESIHIERGHSTVQPESIEMSVRYETARRLLPDMVGGCRAGASLKMTARAMGVTRQVLMDRAATFTDAETEATGCLDCRLCPIISARYPKRDTVDEYHTRRREPAYAA